LDSSYLLVKQLVLPMDQLRLKRDATRFCKREVPTGQVSPGTSK